MSGKGSKQRPTDHKKFSDNYDRIFGKKDKKEKTDERTMGREVPSKNSK